MDYSELKQFRIISTEELQQNLENPFFCLIDVRPIEAYNGWKQQGEKRKGHIKGAKSLPLKWLDYMDWIEIVQNKKILPSQTIVVYGYDIDSSEKTAQQFMKVGYKDIGIYPHFMKEWNPNDTLPMQYLKRYQHLVSAHWLKELISTNNAPEYDNHHYVICHAHYQNKADYDQGHIPQAISLDTNRLESPETWNRRSPEELTQTLKELGINAETTVILYGRFSYPKNADPFPGSSAGHLGAIRCAFLLLYAGVKDVRVLNGGMQSWKDAGFETTTKTYEPQPVDDFGETIPVHPELAIDTKEAKEYLQADNKNLISVRSWKEFIGKVSGYHYIEKKGRIPGAIFGNCGTDAYHMQNYRNLDHTTREYHEIEELWKEAGITPEKHNAFYCGTGWRASEAFFNAYLMGWPHLAVYDGGWFEWTNKGNSYETGIPSEESKKITHIQKEKNNLE